MNRRALLKSTLGASVITVAAAAGLLLPGRVLAAYPKEAFSAKDVSSAVSGALGAANPQQTDQIEIKAPDIAENGSVVPVTISTDMTNVESISIFAESNGTPLVAVFNLTAADAFVSTRIKMGKTGNVVAVVKSGGKLYSNSKEVKVTIGGCGG